MWNFKPLNLFVFFFALTGEKHSIKTRSIENRCYRTGKYSVCRHICASFSLEFLRTGAVKGLRIFFLLLHPHRCDSQTSSLPALPQTSPDSRGSGNLFCSPVWKHKWNKCWEVCTYMSNWSFFVVVSFIFRCPSLPPPTLLGFMLICLRDSISRRRGEGFMRS